MPIARQAKISVCRSNPQRSLFARNGRSNSGNGAVAESISVETRVAPGAKDEAQQCSHTTVLSLNRSSLEPVKGRGSHGRNKYKGTADEKRRRAIATTYSNPDCAMGNCARPCTILRRDANSQLSTSSLSVRTRQATAYSACYAKAVLTPRRYSNLLVCTLHNCFPVATLRCAPIGLDVQTCGCGTLAASFSAAGF